MWVDWSLLRGKTQVTAQVNAAVKAMCPQSVFITPYDSGEGTVWDVSMNEADGAMLLQHLCRSTPMAMGDGRNGIVRDGRVVQLVHNSI